MSRTGDWNSESKYVMDKYQRAAQQLRADLSNRTDLEEDFVEQLISTLAAHEARLQMLETVVLNKHEVKQKKIGMRKIRMRKLAAKIPLINHIGLRRWMRKLAQWLK